MIPSTSKDARSIIPMDVSSDTAIVKSVKPEGLKAMQNIENFFMPGSGGTLSTKFASNIAPTPQIDFLANAKLSDSYRIRAFQSQLSGSQVRGHVGLAKGVIAKLKDPKSRAELADTAKFGYETWSKVAVEDRPGKYQKQSHELEYAPYPPLRGERYAALPMEYEYVD